MGERKIDVVRASSLPSYNDCARRTLADSENFSPELIEAGYRIYTRKATVGPSIGQGLHSAQEAILLSKREGRILNLGEAVEVALNAFRDEIKDGCVWDAMTPNAREAEMQLERMVDAHLRQIAPKIAAEEIDDDSIERELRADIGDGFKLSGHWDFRSSVGLLRDLKGGQDTWPVAAQVGAYKILGDVNGLPVNGAVVDHVPRCKLSKPQLPVTSFAYDIDFARAYAIATLKRVKRDITEFRRTGNIEDLPANPMSEMCSKKLCPIYGTSACQAWKHKDYEPPKVAPVGTDEVWGSAS